MNLSKGKLAEIESTLNNASNFVNQRVSNQELKKVLIEQINYMAGEISRRIEDIPSDSDLSGEIISGPSCTEFYIKVRAIQHSIVPGISMNQVAIDNNIALSVFEAVRSMERCFYRGENESESIDGMRSALSNALQKVDKAQRVIDDVADKVKETENNVNGVLSEVETIKEQAENIKGQVSEYKRKSENIYGDIEDIKNEAESLLQNIRERESQLTSLEEKNKKLLSEAEKTLKGANMVSLSKSFQKMAFWESIRAILWGLVFIASLIGVSYIGWDVVTGVFGNKEITPDFVFTISLKIITAVPLIALSIFSASQYGKHRNIYHDYAYKAASAQAYVAYRDEMLENGADSDRLLSRLQEVLVENFGQNPVRLLLKKEKVGGFKLGTSFGKNGASVSAEAAEQVRDHAD